jgi:hypothetical protein
MKRTSLTGILPVIFLGIATDTPTLIAQSPGTFTATGSMVSGRYGHTATLLRDGRVLIAGGFTDASGLYGGIPLTVGRGVTSTAELYDPVTRQFTPTGNMTAARAYHGATLLQDGRVLIASGQGTDRSEDSLASAELYDPSTGTFTATGSMSTRSYNDVNTATLLRDGRVLITGVSRAELYDPGSGTFTVAANMTVSPTFATATLLEDGRVLLANLENAAIYDPATGGFTPTGGPNRYETGQSVLLPNGKVLVAGGNNDPGPMDAAELYDPSTGTFGAAGKMTAFRSNLTMNLLLGGKALIAGGSTYTEFTLPDGRPGFASACCLNSVELYDPDTGLFAAAGTMGSSRAGHTATVLQSGQVLMVGGTGGVAVDASTLTHLFPNFGSRAGAVALATAELYTPPPLAPSLVAPSVGRMILNRLSGKALDVTNASTANGTLLQQWTGSGDGQQRWAVVPLGNGYYKILNTLTNKALDVTSASIINGALIQQWEDNGNWQQQWDIIPVDSYYKIVNRLSGKLLDVTNASASNGTLIQQWSDEGGWQQQWYFVP